MIGSVRLVLRGAFAEAVADPLRSALAGTGCAVSVCTAVSVQAAEVDPAASLGILVADHDDPVVARFPGTFQEAWRAAGVPSLVVVQHHPETRIGPLDVPDTALCARCFASRARQNGRDAGAAGALTPDAGPAVSVDGYPPYVVALVVALVMERLTVLDGATDARNEVTVANTATLVTRTFPVVPVNGCPQCDDQKPIGVLAGHRPVFGDLDRVPR